DASRPFSLRYLLTLQLPVVQIPPLHALDDSISSLILAGARSGMTTLVLPPSQTLVVVPASLVVSTSSSLWPRRRLCRLNGSAPFSLVTLSGPPLFNMSCANNLEVRFFWP